jgi:hypothetical protein
MKRMGIGKYLHPIKATKQEREREKEKSIFQYNKAFIFLCLSAMGIKRYLVLGNKRRGIGFKKSV